MAFQLLIQSRNSDAKNERIGKLGCQALKKEKNTLKAIELTNQKMQMP